MHSTDPGGCLGSNCLLCVPAFGAYYPDCPAARVEQTDALAASSDSNVGVLPFVAMSDTVAPLFSTVQQTERGPLAFSRTEVHATEGRQ